MSRKTRHAAARDRYAPRRAPALGRHWHRNPRGYRYVKYEGRDVAPMPAGPLHFDSTPRRKITARIARANLSVGARAFAQLLLTYSGNNGHYVFGNQERLAAALGRSSDSLWRYTRELEAAGLIVVERAKPYRASPDSGYTRRWANRYHFVVFVADFLYYRYWWGLAEPPVDVDDAGARYEPPAVARLEPGPTPGSPNAPPSGLEDEPPHDDAVSSPPPDHHAKAALLRQALAQGWSPQ